MFHQEQRVRLLTDDRGVIRELPEDSPDKAVSQKYSKCEVAVKRRTMRLWEQIKLLVYVYTDMNVLGQPTLFLLGVVPLYIGVVGLSRYGHKFDYICAAKPSSARNDEELGSVASASTRASAGDEVV